MSEGNGEMQRRAAHMAEPGRITLSPSRLEIKGANAPTNCLGRNSHRASPMTEAPPLAGLTRGSRDSVGVGLGEFGQ
jgi:hypothetical protein